MTGGPMGSQMGGSIGLGSNDGGIYQSLGS